MTTKPISIVEGQAEIWAQLAPFGTFPALIGDLPVRQVCDEAAFNKLAASFSGEVLLDAEHHSLDATGDTSAYGWIQALKVDPADGLLCKVRLTDLGEADVANRRRRFLSPVWTLDDDGRPKRLLSVALTNAPNIRMRPVLNKSDPTLIAPPRSPADAAGQPTNPPERNPAMDLKALALALGLPETATADEILAAAKAAQDKAATLAARVAELEKAALAAEADQVVASNKAKIVDPEKFKTLYVANKQVALDLLATVATPTETRTVANKAAARSPASGAAGAPESREAAVAAEQAKHGFKRRADAVASAQRSYPDLWKN